MRRLDGLRYAPAARCVQFRFRTAVPTRGIGHATRTRDSARSADAANRPRSANAGNQPHLTDPGPARTSRPRWSTPPHRSDTLGNQSTTLGSEREAEYPLQGICTSITQAPHGRPAICTSARPVWRHWRGVPVSRSGGPGAGCGDAVRRVKESPTSRAQPCTVHARHEPSAQVRALVEWKRAPRACFDPSHRRGRRAARRGWPGARGRGRPSVPQRGPLPPCEIPIRREVPS